MSLLRCCRRITKLEALLRADEGDFLARLGRLPGTIGRLTMATMTTASVDRPAIHLIDDELDKTARYIINNNFL